jgi:hypothetical protein
MLLPRSLVSSQSSLSLIGPHPHPSTTPALTSIEHHYPCYSTMPRRIALRRTDVCHLCDFFLPVKLLSAQSPRSPIPFNSSRTFSTTTKSCAKQTNAEGDKKYSQAELSPRIRAGQSAVTKHLSQADLEEALKQVKAACNNLLSLERLPSERETIQALGQCNSLVELLVLDTPSNLIGTKDAAAALLFLDDSGRKVPTDKLPVSIQRTMNELARLAYDVISHPPIFITPGILSIYTKIQANLGRPETFPVVFQNYANKPVPQEGTWPPVYSKSNPNKIANAVNTAVADRALQAAIDARQLVVALDIIDSTYTTIAFHRAKLVRKCLLPATALTVAPFAAYTVASQLAHWQTTMEPEMATNVAFAGIVAYTFFTGTIGVVAITTANDQMERVTWAPGIPLRERWMREEERAAMDKVAVAWGFRETWRRGEEEGQEWDALREWIGMKGMILDRVELMEGME